MKTIEERADLYCREHAYQGGYDLEDVRTAHISGAEAEHELLTRWNDPNIIPDDNKPVIICTSPGIYYIAAYDKQFNYWFTGNGSFYRHEIIGWREIHE